MSENTIPQSQAADPDLMAQPRHKFEVQVDRVGRSVKNETWMLAMVLIHPINKLNVLADELGNRARRHLMSRDISVDVVANDDDPTSGTFQIFAGFNNGGSGTWREVAWGSGKNEDRIHSVE